jgi:hypothetical protein
MYQEWLGTDGRVGALKTDWTEPPLDAGPMGIEWFAEAWRKGNSLVGTGCIAVGVG